MATCTVRGPSFETHRLRDAPQDEVTGVGFLHILVLGAAGMVGRKLTERLLRDGRLGSRDITRMTLQDVVAPAKPNAGFPVDTVTCDFAVPGAAEKLVADRPDVIFHLAAIVSGEAELDFDKGYRINPDGPRMLFDPIR